MLENRIPPPLVVLVVGCAMWATAYVTPHLAADAVALQALAGGIGILGFCFGASGFLAFSRAGTTIDPVQLERASALVTTGVFRISRNPMYVGFAALLAAWAIYLSAPWSLLGVVVFVLFIRRFQIAPEERVLRAKFGRAYEEYQRRVRRWI